MIYSVLSFLLAASSVSAMRRPRPSFSDFRAGRPSAPTTHPGPNDGQTLQATAVVSCSAESWASAYSASANTYASAVASAVADVCSYNFASADIHPVYRQLENWASAYAEAHAATQAQCSSSVSGGGRAQGCAWAEANAYAVSVAYAEAHASATAEAFATWCVCENAEAWAFGDADLVLVLISEAYAEATSIACASGNQDSAASAYVSCYANIIAKVFAKALAEATATANCWEYSGDAHAVATIRAEVGAELQQYEVCHVSISETGNAGGSVGGSGAQTFPAGKQSCSVPNMPLTVQFDITPRH